MNLLLVSHEYPPIGGGAGVGLAQLARSLAGAGHRVEVVTAGVRTAAAVEDGVRVRRLGCGARGRRGGLALWLRFMRRGPAAVRAAAAAAPPDAVVSFFPIPGGWVAARGSAPAVPHVTTFVGADIHDPTRRWLSADRSPVLRLLTGRVLARCRAVATLSRDMVARVEGVFPGVAVHRIHLGLAPLEDPGVPRRELGLRADGLVVVSLSRLVRRKRIDVLLAAAARVDGLQVVVIGEGPEEAALRELARRSGLADRVRFEGWVEEERKAALLAAADVICMPSEHEAFGLALVEAMGLATAVIASAVGGQSDIVRDGMEGFLVPVGRSDLLAERLAALRDDPDLLARMKAAAARRASELTPQATAAAYLELIEQLRRGASG